VRELIIVRTHLADDASLAAFDRYAASSRRDVTFCCDERKGAVETGGRRKVTLDGPAIEALGLLPHPNAGWRCGDYFHYATRRAMPDYDAYWLIEPDVLINAPDLAAFFDGFADPALDLAAPRFGPRNASWVWHRTIAPDYAAPHGCLFPISRLSGRAIDHLHAARRAAAARMAGQGLDAWPNDEAFVASELVQAGFACTDLNTPGREVYTSRSLRIDAQHDRAALMAAPPDGLIWHPARDLEDWAAKLAKRLEKPVARGPEHSPAPAHRGDASWLGGAAQVIQETGRFNGAALLPLVLAREGFRLRRWASAMPDDGASFATADAGQFAQLDRKIGKLFGPARGARPAATAHLASLRRSVRGFAVADAADFELGEAIPLGAVPRAHALPYAFDLAARDLLMTLHLRPDVPLAAPFLYAAQREQARVAIRVPWDELDAAFGPPDREVRPILVFSPGRTGSTLLDRLLGCIVPLTVSEPDTASQLGVLRGEFASLGPALHDRLVWHALSPLLSRAPDAAQPGCAIKFRAQVNGALRDMLRVFPRARFVFMLRRRLPWARSVFRAFRHRPEQAVGSLVAALKALQLLARSDADRHILFYEDLVAAPETVLAGVLGRAAPLPPDIAARIADVMAGDAQHGTAISRDKTAQPREGEAEWLATFDALWTERKPSALLAELNLDLD
jgi:hypothetical protein